MFNQDLKDKIESMRLYLLIVEVRLELQTEKYETLLELVEPYLEKEKKRLLAKTKKTREQADDLQKLDLILEVLE